jgi:anion-transporting  ArsA/GET3 family ATPase
VTADLGYLVSDHDIVVCTGSGGVGKTTTAAVIALEGARAGRKTVVVTIDPAKRLADALGLDGLTNTPSRIEGDWPGELWALMLDTKGTFDDLVTKHATEPGQAERILGNRFYRNISGALSGTQEYMAMEKLYELHEEHDFDLVVVDTPPTRNALDFLDAPRRLTRFLDHRLYRVVMAPTRGIVKAVGVATQAFLRSVSRVVGGDVVADAITFFQAFDGMEQGFKDRAQRVLELLTHPTTAFVLVTAPRPDVVNEASYFADRLAEGGITVQALIVNRIHPRFTERSATELRALADTRHGTELADLLTNLADFAALADTEERHLEGLTARVAPAPVVRVPFLAQDVHDLIGLSEVGSWLFGPAEPTPEPPPTPMPASPEPA